MDISKLRLDELRRWHNQRNPNNPFSVDSCTQHPILDSLYERVELRKAKNAIFKSMCGDMGVGFRPRLRECCEYIEDCLQSAKDVGVECPNLPSIGELFRILEESGRDQAMIRYERNKGVPWACLH